MKINTKLILSFLLISLVPLIIISVFSYFIAEKALSHQVLNQLESIASIQKHRIQTIIAQNFERLLFVTSNNELRSLLEKFTTDPKEEYQDDLNKILFDVKRSILCFKNLSIQTLEGIIITSTNTEMIGTSHTHEKYFIRGLVENNVDIFFVDDRDIQLMVYLAGPIFTDRLLGVLVIECSLKNILNLVSDYSGLDRTGETILVKRDEYGDGLFLTPTRFNKFAALSKVVSKKETNDPIIQALSKNQKLYTDAVDYREKAVLAATKYIETPGWGLVVKIDKEEAFSSISQLQKLLIITILSSLILVIFISYYFAQNITRPIINLAEVAGDISKGNLSARAAVRTDDEIGILSRVFNQMAKKLLEARTDLEMKIQERTADLKRSNKELEIFAHVASHELQEPLWMIANNMQLLKNHYKEKLDPEAEGIISSAIDGLEGMRERITKLLVSSKERAFVKMLQPTNCEHVLQNTFSNLHEAIKETGASITHGSLPIVMADSSQLTHLFKNLISNAIKFCNHRTPKIHVDVKRKDEEWLFSVEDNGIGISPKNFDRIFLMFQRLHKEAEYPGTGIGLSICKKIAERHGGRIWLDSKPGKGSTFFFTIPIREDERL